MSTSFRLVGQTWLLTLGGRRRGVRAPVIAHHRRRPRASGAPTGRGRRTVSQHGNGRSGTAHAARSTSSTSRWARHDSATACGSGTMRHQASLQPARGVGETTAWRPTHLRTDAGSSASRSRPGRWRQRDPSSPDPETGETMLSHRLVDRCVHRRVRRRRRAPMGRRQPACGATMGHARLLGVARPLPAVRAAGVGRPATTTPRHRPTGSRCALQRAASLDELLIAQLYRHEPGALARLEGGDAQSPA